MTARLTRHNDPKVAVCEYLLAVNRAMHGPFIPPTAINWLGDGLVMAIEPILHAAEAKLAAVEALLDQARKVSPSPSMSVFVGELDDALGRDVAKPRGRVGLNDDQAPRDPLGSCDSGPRVDPASAPGVAVPQPPTPGSWDLCGSCGHSPFSHGATFCVEHPRPLGVSARERPDRPCDCAGWLSPG